MWAVLDGPPSQDSHRPRCGRSMQHTFNADVLIDLRPMDTDAVTDQLPMVALNGSGLGKSP